jgi:para-nitrobenzyl esterase
MIQEKPIMHSTLVTTLVCVWLSQAAPATPETKPTPVWTQNVTIESGQIRGEVLGSAKDIHAFKGIPYAAPPVGELRWKEPQPASKWDGVRDCVEFGNASPQRVPALMAAIPQMRINAPYSEDCLYLNVWAPKSASKTPLPVLYWIHGGGYSMGAASQPIYDGEELARLGCVVVSINYRLGPFGFLAHPALSKENSQNVSGNYGILDQIFGLQWVQRNIAAFGGDPKRVTIFGESAGGGSVLSLLVSPKGAGLFAGAISQSAPEMSLARLREKHRGRESAETQGTKLIAACGLTESADASQMRALSAEVLVKTFPTLEVDRPKELTLVGIPLPMAPIIDGVVIPDDPNQILASAKQNKVPLIVGNTKDEMTGFLMQTKTPPDLGGYTKELADDFGHLAEAMLKAYPGESAKEIRGAITVLLGDMTFVSQARFAARTQADVGLKTFRYEFARGSKQGILKAMGAHHGAELAYIFQRPALPDQTDTMISKVIGQYWVNFAATGNPNGGDLPSWPAYSREKEEMVQFGDEVTILRQHRNDQLDVLDKHLRGQAPKPSAQGN